MFDLAAAYKRGAQIYLERTRLNDSERAANLNASEADTCLRKQWYDKNFPRAEGEEIDGGGFMRRGHVMEAHVVEVLRAANVPLDFAGEDQESIVDDAARISATPDGEILIDGVTTLLEIKSIDPRSNMSKLPRQKHVTQVQLAMDLWQRMTVDGTMAGAWLLYVNASDYDDIYPHFIPFRPGIVDQYAGRAKRVLGADKAEVLPAEGVSDGQCRTCRHTGRCKAGKQAAPVAPGRKPTATGKAATVLAPLVDRIVALDRLVAEQKALREELKASMIKAKLKEVEGNSGSASLTEREGAERLDRKAMEEGGIDLAPYIKKGAPSVSLTVAAKE